jgi:phosphopantetheinyl transferase (holo-ACP synthase)
VIGNDVIDISAAGRDSNWQRKGFIEKLFTATERQLIHAGANPELMVWILWSMKEAAYKAYNRHTQYRGFIPLKLICSLNVGKGHEITGSVRCGELTFYTKTNFDEKIINTIAVIAGNDINRIYEIPDAEIIKDDLGFPYIYTADKTALRPVSVSHHGEYHKTVGFNNN